MGPTFDGVAAPFVLAGYMPFICVIVSSVRGKVNPVGDSHSHFQFERFRCLTPQADLTLCVTP